MGTGLGKPREVFAAAPNWQTANVTWDDPNSEETGYVLTYRDYAGGEDITVNLDPNTTSYSITGLAAGHDYHFGIKAVGNNNSLLRETDENLTMPAWGTGTPAAISNLTAEPWGNGIVRFHYTDNASDESGYLVTYHKVNADGSSGPTQTATLGATSSSDADNDLGGLDPETTYHFEVTPLGPTSGGGGGGSGSGPASAPTVSAERKTDPDVETGKIFDFSFGNNSTGAVTWTPKAIDPQGGEVITDKSYILGNETITITFTGLKTHQYVSIDALFNSPGTTADQPVGQIEIKAGNETFTPEAPRTTGSHDEFRDEWSYLPETAIVPHTGSTLTLTIKGTNFGDGNTMNYWWWVRNLKVNTVMPGVSIDGNGATSENGTAADRKVKFTVKLDGGPLPEEIEVPIEKSGDAATTQYEGLPTTVKIPKGQTSVDFYVTAKDDNVAENKKDDSTTTQKLILKVGAGEKYVASHTPATMTIKDDSRWYYSPWIKKSGPPTVDNNPPIELGENDWNDGSTQRIVKQYWYFDAFIPLGQGERSDDYGKNAALTSMNIGFSESHSVTVQVQQSAQVPGGTIQWTLYNRVEAKTASEGVTKPLDPVVVGADEMGLLLPLVEMRYLHTRTTVYTKLISPDGDIAPNWTLVGTPSVETEAVGYTGDANSRAYVHTRYWLDDDDSTTTGKTTTPPENRVDLLPD